MPKVSVLMSVWNEEQFVQQAVESILSQTFTDFEFIIIDDASTDSTFKVLSDYTDQRIHLIRNKYNLGITVSLNIGLEITKGEYIARLDADDLAAPKRLELQLEFLENNPEVGLVGSWSFRANEDLSKIELVKKPTTNSLIQQKMLYFPVFDHPTVMFRRKCVEIVGSYNPEFLLAQDKDLWLRIAERFQVDVIPIPLTTIRNLSTSLGHQNRSLQNSFALLARERAIQRRLNGNSLCPPTKETLARYYLYRASIEYLLGNRVEVICNLQKAFETWEKLYDELNDVIIDFTYQAYNRWLETKDKAFLWNKASTEINALIDIFSEWSTSCERVKANRRKIRAHFYLIFAFGAYQAGDYQLVPKSCLIALIHNPVHLKNRGVVSIFLRSCFRIFRYHTGWKSRIRLEILQKN